MKTGAKPGWTHSFKNGEMFPVKLYANKKAWMTKPLSDCFWGCSNASTGMQYTTFMMIMMITMPSMRNEFGWPQGCRFQFCRQLACNVSLVQDPQVMWWLCGWGRNTDEHDLDQCQIFPKHTHCLWNCYIFYVHSISECNGQNICTSSKQLLITDSFGK